MHCHLLIPGLILPESAGAALLDDPALPALELLLARGALEKHPGMSLEGWLAAAFRVAPQYDLPLAPLSLRGEGVDPGDAWWLRADPVHLEAQRGELMLADASCFEVAGDEAADMLSALNAHFREDGLEFVAPVPQRWYVRLAGEARIRTTPAIEVAGRSIGRFLPAGDDAPRWHRLINEAQMLLHTHKRNEAREARGELPINSVWFWGAGRAPGVGGDAHYDGVWSDQPLAAGLAAVANVEAHPLPPSGAALLETSHPPFGEQRTLVVVDWLRGAACNDRPAWANAAARLEALWFAPLLDALKRGSLGSLTVHALGPDVSLTSASTRLDQLKLWRARRPLGHYSLGDRS